MLGTSLFSFSQARWNDQSELVIQLQKGRADTSRVHVLIKLGQYYLFREFYFYKTGNPRTQFDTASWFAEQALHLSEALKYEPGKNEAILLKGDAFIRKHEIRSALDLLGTLHDSTRFRLLITLGRHYLFHTGRSTQDLDSAQLFLEEATHISPVYLSERWQPERMHINAMYCFITKGLQQSKKLYKELIDNISRRGNEEAEALLWHELATLIPLHEKTGITRLFCFENMLSLYDKDANKERAAWVLKTIADIHLVNGRLDLAEREFLDALERYKAIGYRDLHYIYDLLSVTYRYKGDFSKCIFYGLKTIESMEATRDSSSITTFYSRLANMYRELGQSEKSVEWYSKMLGNRIFKDGGNEYVFRDAGLFARELIKIKREKEALTYILDITAKNKPIGVHAEACLLSSLAYCYHATGQDLQSEKYYLEVIKLAGQLQDNHEITTEVHFEIGKYFIDKLQYGKAVSYLQKALNISANVNSFFIAKDIHLMLYKADSAMGNHLAAIQHLLRHKQLSDSMFNEAKNWQIEELQVQYETAKKEKDIQSLSNQNQLQRIRGDQAIRTKNITLAGVVLLLIIVGLLFNRYLIKRNSNHRLEAHQKELDQQNQFLETLNAEKDKLIGEKEWLIREVHHRVKNNLQMVTSLLNTQSAYLENDAAVLAVKDSSRRMQAMSLIHQKLYLSKNISSVDMPEYINELLSYLRDSFDTGNRIVFQPAIEPLTLDVSQAIPLGLIINESIVNSIKYAFINGQKGTVNIRLQHESSEGLVLNISDNGVGLPENFDIEKPNSLGLDLIRGLVKQLNGTLEIESIKGMHITITFAMKSKEFNEKALVSF